MGTSQFNGGGRGKACDGLGLMGLLACIQSLPMGTGVMEECIFREGEG